MSDNMYYSPEKFGLRQLAVIDFSDGCYQFDYRVLWLHEKSGRLYTGRDSGCSCPCPFEDYHSLEALEVANFVELIEEARKVEKGHYDGDPVAPFVAKLKELQKQYT